MWVEVVRITLVVMIIEKLLAIKVKVSIWIGDCLVLMTAQAVVMVISMMMLLVWLLLLLVIKALMVMMMLSQM